MIPFIGGAPTRILDTRAARLNQSLPSPLAAKTPYTVQVSGKGGVPSGAQAALLSVTSIEPGTGNGNLRVYPGGGSLPNSSNINYIGSQFDVANFVIAPLSSDGKITLYSAGSPVNVAVDVLGYVLGTGGTTTSSGAPSSSSSGILSSITGSTSGSSSSSSSSSTSATATSTCIPIPIVGGCA